MSKYQWISVLGVWVMIFLFLGFPTSWDEGIAVVTGLVIIAIAYRIGAQFRAVPTTTVVLEQTIHNTTTAGVNPTTTRTTSTTQQ